MDAPALRPARPEDHAEIVALLRELADYERMADEAVFDDDEMGTWLFGPTPRAFVTIAEVPGPDGPVVAGLALWYWTLSTFLGKPGIWLEDLFVRPQHRGLGLGKALLVDLRDRTDGRVEWAVLDWNEPSIAFYRSLGAVPVEGWTRYRWLPEQAGDR